MDAVLLLVGGVIGSGIFLTPGVIAKSVGRPDLFLLVWVAGGVISLLACLAVAELAGMFPHAGGPYVFLRHAFGELPAFLYGWMIFTVAQTGTIAALGVGFAIYLGAAFPSLAPSKPLLAFNLLGHDWALTVPSLVAAVSIALLTWVNVVGLRRGSTLVNIATWLKFAAMAAIVLFGLLFGRGDWSHFRQAAENAPSGSKMLTGFGVALISVLFAFDGWVYITWVASEVGDAARAVPKALMAGTGLVVAIYVAMNVVYLYALPIGAITASDAVAQASMEAMFSSRWATLVALMVALSCFGAMSSAILCTARIFYAMAQDGLFFARMAEVHPRYRTPAFALVLQGVWATVLALIGLYDQLLTYAIFMMILGYVATVAALFILRRKVPDHPRPYRCWGYPWVPGAYLVLALAWTLNTLAERPLESFGGLVIVLLGVPAFMYWKRTRKIA